MDENVTKLGLLMETALTYQNLAEEALNRLKAHTNGLDGIIREEVRRTFVDEMKGLAAECKRATQALEEVKRAANLRIAVWSTGITILCCVIAMGSAWWVMPSQAEIARLHARREQLAAAVAHLEQLGGRIELRRCGQTEGDNARLCVRVEPKSPKFGEQGDYLVVKGY